MPSPSLDDARSALGACLGTYAHRLGRPLPNDVDAITPGSPPSGERRCFGLLRFHHDGASAALVRADRGRRILALRGGIGRELVSAGSVLRRDTPLGLLANAPGSYDAGLREHVARAFPDMRGFVHPGMGWRLSLLDWDAVENALGRRGDAPIVVTGHSLGGGLATLAGALLSDRGLSVQQVITFGAPRVGDAEFAAAYRVPLTRFEFAHDPVPILAAPGFDLRGVLPRAARRALGADQVTAPIAYRHTGRLVYLDSAGRTHRAEPGLCRRRTTALLRTSLTRDGRDRMLGDHVIPSYARMIRTLRRR